jgi:hypothetical protein
VSSKKAGSAPRAGRSCAIGTETKRAKKRTQSDIELTDRTARAISLKAKPTWLAIVVGSAATRSVWMIDVYSG